DDYVVEVRDDKVRVTELPVEGRAGEHDSGEAGDQELKEESEAEQHRRFELDAAAPQGAEPIEDFDSGGDADGHRGDGEEAVGVGIHADSEHVVRPDAHADESDEDGGADHHRVSEDRFAREDGNDFGDKGEGGEDQDVDFGMPEDPEEMHPERGGSAGLGI